MNGSGNDVVLNALVKLCEVSQVACNTNQKVLVVFRMCLRVTKRIIVYNVDLDVVSVVFEICLYNTAQSFDTLFTGNGSWVETQVL